MSYIIGIDQSTQGTKVLLFDGEGKITYRADRAHAQLVNEAGWVSHDMGEVYDNLIDEVREIVEKTGVNPEEIKGVGISNQRETTVAWGADGTPLAPAIVWQCGRAKEITERLEREGSRTQADYGWRERTGEQCAAFIRERTGIPLSPFFPAAKMAWLLTHEEAVKAAAAETGVAAETAKAVETVKTTGAAAGAEGSLHLGTVDSYLVYRLTKGKTFATDYSNASRTQLFDLHTLTWNEEICRIFGVPVSCLPKVCDSNANYGSTDFEGVLPKAVPILGVLGDSHGALFGQGCHQKGMMKTTYGTGSSMMLNAGDSFVSSSHGLATSLAWGIDGKVSYVLEGNINYTGAVISWLKDDLELIASPAEVEPLIAKAHPGDTAVVVPAFTGLGAPYWANDAKAAIVGMTRTTGKPELARAATESIAHQIADVYEAMEQDFGSHITELRADGGPTKNAYLMQFQADMTGAVVSASTTEELSAIGAAYLAGIAAECYDKDRIFENISYKKFEPAMEPERKEEKRGAWKEAVKMIL